MQRWTRLPILAIYGCYAAVQVHAWNQNMKLKIELISTKHTHIHSCFAYILNIMLYFSLRSFEFVSHMYTYEFKRLEEFTVRFDCSHFSWVEQSQGTATCTHSINETQPSKWTNIHGMWLYGVQFSALFVLLFHVHWRCLVNTKFTWTRENRIKVTVLCVCVRSFFSIVRQNKWKIK